LDAILLIHLLSTFALTGLIWTVQLVHYPMFLRLDRTTFTQAMVEHQRRITWIVLPLMLAEVCTTVLLLINRPVWIPAHELYFAAFLVVVIWVSTLTLQMPCHQKLLKGQDPKAIDRLVTGNWIRTVAWSMRSLLLAGWLWAMQA